MIRVAIPARATARTSAGMRAYARELVERLPRVAPDIVLVRRGAQLVHLPYLEGPPFVPRLYTAMVHDCIHLRFPALFSPTTAAYWRLVAIPRYRGAARLLVSDPRVADDCVRLLGVERERIRVVPLGYDEAVLRVEPWPAERPYLFYAGNHRPHKDLATLYAAWRALAPELELDLVLTGPDEPDVRARHRRARGEIVFLGEVDATTLARRYRGALAYVQPSLAEGFGIPALEAAVAATPVVATRSSIPAIVAPFATTFEACDVAALSAILDALARDPRTARARAAEGALLLRAYTWDRFAAETAAVFREVVCS